MALSNRFLLKLKRGETPFYRFLKRTAQTLLRAHLPVPRFLKPLFCLLYELHFLAVEVWHWVWAFFYRQPLFRARCVRVGKRFHLERLPYVNGHVEIHIGDDVAFAGRVDILSGHRFDRPKLILHDRVSLGHNVVISVSREVVLEEDVRVASDCRIADSDGHPADADMRARNLPPRPDEIHPVRICRKAWVGRGCYVMKGVTIGEGAIIGANSVVMTNIPPYCVAVGNPAEVLFRDVGRPREAPAPAD